MFLKNTHLRVATNNYIIVFVYSVPLILLPDWTNWLVTKAVYLITKMNPNLFVLTPVSFFSLSGELIVERRRKISEKLLKHYVRQICDALNYIHERLIFHHGKLFVCGLIIWASFWKIDHGFDITTYISDIERNIMCITEDSDDIKLFDFGLSAQTDTMDVENGIFPNIGGFKTDTYDFGVLMYYL